VGKLLVNLNHLNLVDLGVAEKRTDSADSGFRSSPVIPKKFSLKDCNSKNINGKQDLCQDFGSSVPDSRCGNFFFAKNWI
jgi:hypothetical protein